jgi:hypothetical protein
VDKWRDSRDFLVGGPRNSPGNHRKSPIAKVPRPGQLSAACSESRASPLPPPPEPGDASVSGRRSPTAQKPPLANAMKAIIPITATTNTIRVVERRSESV